MMESSISTLTVAGHATAVLTVPIIPVVAAVGFFGGMLSYLYYRPSYSRAPNPRADILQATKEYNRELDRVIEDRNNIILAIKDLNQRSKVLEDRNNDSQSVYRLSQSVNDQASRSDHGSNSYRLFFESGRTPQSWHSEQEKVTREEMSDIFEKLMFSYPQFDDERKNDPNYVRVAHKELVEHHLLVLASKKQYFDSVNKALEMYEKNEKKGGVGTPGLGGRN